MTIGGDSLKYINSDGHTINRPVAWKIYSDRDSTRVDLFLSHGVNLAHCSSGIFQILNTEPRTEGIQVKIFPNPSLNTVFLESPHYLEFTLKNTLGQTLFRGFHSPSQPASIEIPQKGIYFLFVRNKEEELVHIEKILRN